MSASIEVVLVYTGNNKNIKELIEIDKGDYPRGVVLGEWNDDGNLYIRPYCQVKFDEGDKNVDIAIKTQNKSNIKSVVLNNGDNKYDFQKHEEDVFTYYLTPKLWKGSKEPIVGHYTSLGYETIVIEYEDGSSEKMRLKSDYYLKEDEDFWKDLILDLISIQQKLCINDKSAISVGIDWATRQYKRTEKLVDEFYKAFNRIEGSPVPVLIGEKEKIDFNKLKRITPRALIEHDIQHKDKVSELVYRESYDTFEHRVIKTYLGSLKNFIELRIWSEKSTLEASKSRYMENILGDDKEFFNQEIEDSKFKNTNAEENSGFFKSKKRAMEQVGKIKKYLDDNNCSYKWEELSSKLKHVEDSSLMKLTADIQTEPCRTNLFAYNEAYKSIFSVIEREQKEIIGVEFMPRQSSFPVDKLAQLYEKWCCIRIVLLFVQTYGFNLIEVNSIANKSNKQGKEALQWFVNEVLLQRSNLSGSKFVMENKDLIVTLWYDKKIILEKTNKKSLRPDYIMRIKEKRGDGRDKLFVLDAKCKGDKYKSASDLCKVAYQKYTYELNEYGRIKESLELEKDMKVSGSFIIYCGEASDSRAGYNPKNYLGTHPDEHIDNWLRNIDRLSSNNHDDEDKNKEYESKFREWCAWKAGQENNENRLGIVLSHPKQDNLPYLIQMIMEHFFERYQDYCWLCGKKLSDSDIQVRSTYSNYKKYHITCPECGQFWVQTHCRAHGHRELGKHIVNYYAPLKKGNKTEAWNVSCPWCREHAGNSDNSKDERNYIVNDNMFRKQPNIFPMPVVDVDDLPF